MTNLVILTGRLGGDPEIYISENEKKIATFSLATADYYKDKSGKTQQKTEWHNIVAFEGVAKIAQNHLKKGELVQVMGKLSYNNYTDKQGNKKTKAQVVANKFVFGFSGQQEDPPSQQETPEKKADKPASKPQEQYPKGDEVDLSSQKEGDLPF